MFRLSSLQRHWDSHQETLHRGLVATLHPRQQDPKTNIDKNPIFSFLLGLKTPSISDSSFLRVPVVPCPPHIMHVGIRPVEEKFIIQSQFGATTGRDRDKMEPVDDPPAQPLLIRFV